MWGNGKWEVVEYENVKVGTREYRTRGGRGVGIRVVEEVLKRGRDGWRGRSRG